MPTGADSGSVAKSGVDRFSRGSNQSGMRAYNERLVLSLVRHHGSLAKIDLARMTGLSAQTVSVITRELEAEGLIERGKPVRGKVGQPSIPMSLSPHGASFLGLKLGRRSADLVLIDFVGNILASVHHTYRYPTPEDTVRFARDAMARLTAVLEKYPRSRIGGLGIAMPFQLWNWADTIGAPKGAMDAWRDRDIRAEIAEDVGFPVYLQNDGTAACGAELVFGRPSYAKDFLYFYVGFFIGGGVVLNGSLHPGNTGNAGALGSMPVPDGEGGICQLIDVASVAKLERALDTAGQSSTALWASPDDWDIDRDTLKRWIDDASRGIAHAVVASASVMDFEEIVIDGWLPIEVRQAIVQATRKHVAAHHLAGLDPPDIREGTVGHDARALGGASLPLSERFLVRQSALSGSH